MRDLPPPPVRPGEAGLVVEGVSRRFGPVRAVSDVSFRVAPGRMSALLGPNGAGKSTLLHCVTGLLSPDAGEVRLHGVPQRQDGARSGIGFAPDDLPMPDLLTGWEYLDLVAGLHRLPRDRGRAEQLAGALHLDHALDRLVGGYSHGMKRKIQLLAALDAQPDVLVLDEPFRGLDPESGALLKGVLLAYTASGRSVLMSTHDLLVAEQMCEDLVVLAAGRLLAAGSVEELLLLDDSPSLEAAFLRLTGLDAVASTSAAQFLEALGA